MGKVWDSFYEVLGMCKSNWQPALIGDIDVFEIMQCYYFLLYIQCTVSYQHKYTLGV